jgi:single-strand DNA-binding protein
VDGELQSRSWKSDEGLNRNVVEIKARRIQFLNKLSRPNSPDNGFDSFVEEEHIFADDEGIDYTEDSFDKFLSNEESNLLK